MWRYLSSQCLNYPEHNPAPAQRECNRVFFRSLMRVLCCKYCRDSSLVFMEELPVEAFLDDRAGLCLWLYLFKDRVNRKLGKRSCSFYESILTHERYRAKCAKKDGLGCTEPAVEKCEAEVAAWCEDALRRYSNYPERIAAFRRQQTVKRVAKAALVAALLALLVWLVAPRARQLLKKR